MNMREMTREEITAHKKKLEQIRSKTDRARNRWEEGLIGQKKFYQTKDMADKEETEYLKTSGIFLYFGKLFKRVPA